MANVIYSFNSRLEKIGDRLSADRKKSFAVGLFIYTIFYAVYFCISLLPGFLDTGTILGADGIAQYYPFLMTLRRDLLTFFDNIAAGNPTFPMMNFNFAYGADTFSAIMPDFLPALPFYALSVLVPEGFVATFYGIGVIFLDYISGITCLYLFSYFGKNTAVAGFFAPFYALCGNSFFTALYNAQFLYMLIAFPLMIVGMDKIIRKKGAILFIVATGWLSLSGFASIVYTIPFVVLFAILRVRFVYKEHYFRNLGNCFIRGFCSFILAIGLGMVILLPAIAAYLGGVRSGISSPLSIGELLIPEIIRAFPALMTPSAYSPTGIWLSAVPFIMLALLKVKKTNSELKCYMLVMLLLICLPLISYGLNGFQYELCRWGFIPALLFCYLLIDGLDELKTINKRHIALYALFMGTYYSLIVFAQYYAAVIFLLAVAIIVEIPLFRKATAAVLRRIHPLRNRVDTWKVIIMAVVTVFVLMLICAGVFGLYSNYTMLIYSLVAGGIVICIILAARLRKARGVVCIIMAAFIVLSNVLQLSGYDLHPVIFDPFPVEKLESSEVVNLLTHKTHKADDGGTFGRLLFTCDFSGMYSPYVEEEEPQQEEGGESEYDEATLSSDFTQSVSSMQADSSAQTDPSQIPGVGTYSSDPMMNLALRMDIPEIYVFQSIINGSYFNMADRLGQDQWSMFSLVDLGGFGGNEPMYSLFGVRYLYTQNEIDRFYGLNGYDDYKGGIYVYTNDYALPLGVTYSDVGSKDDFDTCDAATLPFYMLNEIYLEGNAQSENSGGTGRKYSIPCDFTHDKKERGTTTFGMECYDNTLKINNDLSDCFVYITFDGVDCRTYETMKNQPFTVNADKTYSIYSIIHNINYTWDWLYYNDHYTIPLGYFEKGPKELTFINSFNYDNVYVTAVPRKNFTDAFDKLTSEKLENTYYGNNIIAGDLTVTSDKVLSVNMLYNKGWKAYIDGAEAPVYKANGLFLGVPVSAGSHKRKLEFTPPYLKEGCIISAVSVVCLIGLAVF